MQNLITHDFFFITINTICIEFKRNKKIIIFTIIIIIYYYTNNFKTQQ